MSFTSVSSCVIWLMGVVSFFFPNGKRAPRSRAQEGMEVPPCSISLKQLWGWVSPLLVMGSHIQLVYTNDFSCFQHYLWLSAKPSLLSHHPPPPMNHKSNKITKPFSGLLRSGPNYTQRHEHFLWEAAIKTSRLSVCSGARTAAYIHVSKPAVSSSQDFYNLRAGRAEDDELFGISIDILLLDNVTYCTMPPTVVKG